MSIRGEVITTSGFAEAILEVLGTAIGLAVVKNRCDLEFGRNVD